MSILQGGSSQPFVVAELRNTVITINSWHRLNNPTSNKPQLRILIESDFVLPMSET